MIGYIISFVVALLVSVAVYWVGTAVFHLAIVVAGLDVIAVLCFVLFLSLMFGGVQAGWYSKWSPRP